MVSVQTLAANNLYIVFSVGYSDVEFIQEPDKNLGYIMLLVISLTPQWYVEAGYQQLIHNTLYSTVLPTATDITNGENVQQGDAFLWLFSVKRLVQLESYFIA